MSNDNKVEKDSIYLFHLDYPIRGDYNIDLNKKKKVLNYIIK